MKRKQERPRGSTIIHAVVLPFKVIGLATISIEPQPKRNATSAIPLLFVRSRLCLAYNLLLTLLILGSSYLSIPYRLYTDYPNKTAMTTCIEILQTVLGWIAVSTILFSYCLNQGKLVRLGNRLAHLEQLLEQYERLSGSSSGRSSIILTSMIACSLNVGLFLSLLISEYLAYRSSPVSWLSDLLPAFHIGWLLVQYFLLGTLLQERFAYVNQGVRGLARNWPSDHRRPSSQTRRVFVSFSTIQPLIELRTIHEHLCEISEEVSEFYSVPTLAGITFVLFTFVYNAYYLIVPVVLANGSADLALELNTVIWIIFLLYPVLLLTDRITRVVNEIGKTGSIVHSLLNCAIDRQSKSELLHRNIRFTASGYFVLDNTLFHSIVATGTAYLVILLQFQMGHSNPNSNRNST